QRGHEQRRISTCFFLAEDVVQARLRRIRKQQEIELGLIRTDHIVRTWMIFVRAWRNHAQCADEIGRQLINERPFTIRGRHERWHKRCHLQRERPRVRFERFVSRDGVEGSAVLRLNRIVRRVDAVHTRGVRDVRKCESADLYCGRHCTLLKNTAPDQHCRAEAVKLRCGAQFRLQVRSETPSSTYSRASANVIGTCGACDSVRSFDTAISCITCTKPLGVGACAFLIWTGSSVPAGAGPTSSNQLSCASSATGNTAPARRRCPSQKPFRFARTSFAMMRSSG